MSLKSFISSIVISWIVLASTAQATQLQGFSFEVGQAAERITILTSGKLKQKKAFLLQNPNRLVLDFERFNAARADLPETYSGRLIKSVRTGVYQKSTTRIVFDLNEPVDIIASYHVQPEGQLWRFVMDVKAAKVATPPNQSNNIKKPQPVSTSKIDTNKATAKPSFKPIIVLDPGHGGQDPGALGKLHKEKDLTLRFTKSLQKALLATGKYQVFLTRETDKFIPLKERVKIARGKKASLFISLHADSNPNKKARGLSVYTLSATASDKEAAALAAQENKADVIDGVDLGGADDDVADILIDLTQRETLSKSTEFADTLIKKLKGKVPLLPRPHRYAGFRVLKAPDVPSVLIELGFLSNKEDERRLASPRYRKTVVKTLTEGINEYWRE